MSMKICMYLVKVWRREEKSGLKVNFFSNFDFPRPLTKKCEGVHKKVTGSDVKKVLSQAAECVE